MTKAERIRSYIRDSSNPFDAISEILAAGVTNTQLNTVLGEVESEESQVE